MSNYVKTTDFAAKDALATGNPNKKALGTQVDTEFNNIATATNSKEDAANKGAVNGYAPLNASTQLADTYLTSNVPLKNANNIFTAMQTVSSTAPIVQLDETDGGTNARYWLLRANGGQFALSTALDASGSTVANNALLISRSAGTVTAIALASTALTWNGNTLFTTANDGAGSGLDADLLDGQDGAFYLAASTYTASDVLTKIKTVDGAGSGLDADLLDGISSGGFSLAGHTHPASDIVSGTFADARIASSNVTQYAAAVLAAGGNTSGVFTPTGTTGTGISAITPGPAFYHRIGNYAFVRGTATVTGTAATGSCAISLPVASNLTAATDLTGTMTAATVSSSVSSGYISGDITNDRATLTFSGSSNLTTIYYEFAYVVQ